MKIVTKAHIGILCMALLIVTPLHILAASSSFVKDYYIGDVSVKIICTEAVTSAREYV